MTLNKEDNLSNTSEFEDFLKIQNPVLVKFLKYNNDNLIQWYFDIAKEIGIENNIPYEDDLYVDIVITPNGRKEILDEEELMDALNKNEITQEDVELVYETVKLIEDKFVNNFSYLTDLTDKFLKMFDIN